MASFAIAGAGVLGRLLAWTLSRRGHQVEVVDPASGPEPPPGGQGAAAFTAAGLLSPLAELENAGGEIATMGARALPRWQAIGHELARTAGTSELVQCRGSLLLARPGDAGIAARVLSRLAEAPRLGLPAPRALSCTELARLEPAVAPGLQGWWLEGEGRLLPTALMPAFCHAAPAVRWHWGRRAQRVQPGRLDLDGGQVLAADWAVDTRGLGARDTLPLRGVRGELLWLHAPECGLQRPLRLLHPRHRVYLVPRPGDMVVAGASEIESEDQTPISVATALELLAASCAALPCLAEARIVRQETHLRPALPDNRPLLDHFPGLLRINGLFRHGWLLAPALVDDALAMLELA